MPDENGDDFEVKISPGLLKRMAPWIAGAAMSFAAGGGAGTYLAPKASAQTIEKVAEDAADKAVLKERELTDAKIGAIKEDISELKDDVKEGNREQRALLNDVLQRLPRDPVER